MRSSQLKIYPQLPLFILAHAGNLDILAGALCADGETAPRTVARAMISAAKHTSHLPPVKWVRNDRNILLCAIPLHWNKFAGAWQYFNMFYMFGA